MTSHVPAADFRARLSASCMAFAGDILTALYLKDLLSIFDQAIELEGGIGHSCSLAIGPDRNFIFGAHHGSPCGSTQEISFALTGWDEKPYIVGIMFPANMVEDISRANLHALSALYLSRGLALSEATGERDNSAALTVLEQKCVSAQKAGHSNLDIGEPLGLSVQAVSIYLQRAQLKMQG